jgi:hypothetical protein
MIIQGPEFVDFIKRQNLNDISRENLVNTTKRILLRTELLGSQVSNNCQLVVGEVQSGKTMSFTSLMALAHDNGFPIVVVLAGTKDQLLKQTADRLKKDLRADGNGGPNAWNIVVKPKVKQRESNVKSLQRALTTWKQPNAPAEFKPTVIFSILKNRTSLDEVTELLSALKPLFDVNEHPVLIIDDEGDQAGLNLNWQNDEESTVYAAIGRLRRSLPKHSYVMYTATPQGPLLLNIQDTLSPKFVTLLKSGDAYLGGEELFVKDSNFIMKIPEIERPQIFDSTKGAPAPDSLKRALAFYLLSLDLAQKRSNPRPLSMLIHPSAQKSLHSSYETWVNSILSSWELILHNPEEGLFEQLKREYFEDAFKELSKTVELPSGWNLDEVLKQLPWWITTVEVRVINSDKSDINPGEWLSHPGWVLIGGNKLERGFTVENLAVTYMPRSTGIGNVDVIQQRGRFFGYKRSYKDILRGWFFEDHIEAYISYVDHEKSIRSQLGDIDINDQELSTWRRRFLLDPAYQPVRNQVISLGINHRRLSIFKQQMLYDLNLARSCDPFLNQRIYPFVVNEVRHPSDHRKDTGNYVVNLELEDALSILADWPMAPENRMELDDILWAIQSLAGADVIQRANLVIMDWDPSIRTQTIRERSPLHQKFDPSRPDENQTVGNIFQGPSMPIYPGDSEMKSTDSLTIQVHKVAPMRDGARVQVVAVLGLILPSNARGFIVENQS